LVAFQLADEFSLAHDQDARGEIQQFGKLGGDEHDGDALAGEVVDESVDRGLGADVDAASRFIDDQELGVSAEPFGQGDLLLITAAEASDGGFQRRGFDVEAVEKGPGGVSFGVLVYCSHPAESAEHGQGEVLAAAHLQNQTLVLAIFGNQCDSTAHGRAHVSKSQRLGFEDDGSGGAAIEAEDGRGDLATAGADEAGESDDFAGLNVEAHVVKLAGRGEMFHGKNHVAGGFVEVVGEIGFDAAADHHADDGIRIGVGAVEGSGAFSVAEDGDAIAEPKDFGEAVGDVNHGDAARFQTADQGKEVFGIGLREGTGGLVKDENAGAGSDG